MWFLKIPPEITLFVTNKEVHAYRALATEALSMGSWPLEIEGLVRDDLQDFLREQRTAIFTVVVDISEEEFSTESIPRVKAKDREAMLKRKLAQRYREADYRVAYPLSKPSLKEWNSNKQTSYIFTALTQVAPLEGLLKVLAQNETRLRGVYTTSFLGAAAIDLLKLPKDMLLILEHQDSLRQVLIMDGKVRFARLAQINESDNPDFYSEELARIAQYLLIGRLIDRDHLSAGNLKVVILSERPIVPITATWPSGNRIEAEWKRPSAFQSQYQIKQHETNPFGIEWFYTWAKLRNACSIYYQPSEGLRFWRVELAKKKIIAGCLGLALAALLFGLWRYGEIREQESIAHQNRVQTDQIKQQYEKIKAGFPALPVHPSEMRIKVDLLELVDSRGTVPDSLLKLIAYDFNNFPDLRITDIAWKVGDPNQANKTTEVVAPSSTEPTASANNTGLPPSGGAGTIVPPPSANPGKTLKPREVKIEGLITPSKPLSKQEANAEVTRLQNSLKSRCDCEITVQLPFDISLGGNIADQSGQHGERIAPAKFVLTLRFARIGHVS